MGWFDWLKSNEEDLEESGEEDENFIIRRAKTRKWIKVVFSIPITNEKNFNNDIKVIEKETHWNAKEDYLKLKEKGVTIFQVGGFLSVKDFLKLKESILKTRKKLSRSNENPIWYVLEESEIIGETIGFKNGKPFVEKEKEEWKAYNLVESFDVGKSLVTPLLSIIFFLERLQDLNKKDKKLTKEILGDNLENIKLSNDFSKGAVIY